MRFGLNRAPLFEPERCFSHLNNDSVQSQVQESVSIIEPKYEIPSGGNTVNKILEQKKFRQEKYLNVLRKFMDDCCEYDFCNMTSNQEVKQAYYEYIKNIDEYDSTFNINYRISVPDIALLDDRYVYKRIKFCSSCNHKQYSGCCENYKKTNCSALYYIVNLKLKKPNLVDSSSLDNH